MSEHSRKGHTSDTDAVDVLRLNALALEDVIHLWASAMKDNRVETEAVEETEAESKLLEVIENCPSNFEDSKFCRLGRVGRGRENAKVTLDLTFRTERVEQARDRVLHACQHDGGDGE